MKKYTFFLFLSIFYQAHSQPELQLNDKGYFEMKGLNVIVFSDIYPEGHQTGVTVIQHGNRTAANGDLRLEISPGQWSPVPKGGERSIDPATGTITQRLWYPDSSKNRRGFNPVIYPDLTFSYQVNVSVVKGNTFRVTVDLDEPLPDKWIGKVGFNFELFPGDFFGKAYLMDDQSGIFPLQPNGPIREFHDDFLALPLAVGKELIVAPEEDLQRMKVVSKTSQLELWDGRTNHNNGWFIVRSVVPANAAKRAVEWEITPHVVSEWEYKPVIQVSQLGYHPDQPKIAVIEKDPDNVVNEEMILYKLANNGRQEVKREIPARWGEFLRYEYLTLDFSEIMDPGMYQILYGTSTSNPFKISRDVYQRHAWQPTLEYYLPVQMCHMRINEKYRVWHGSCHLDDALMAPLDTNHFDGYMQGPSTLTKFKPLEPVPGLDRGGWHDAGDYDLRVESQIGTVWMLALMIEEFGLDYDATMIDQENRIVEIHVPDGKSDALQQIEHGLLTVLGGYRSLGRLYRGIICSDIRQYVLLGDGSTMTDNLVYDSDLAKNEQTGDRSGRLDDRLVFTEENPRRELYVAAGLAAASRVLKDSNPELSAECLETAITLYNNNPPTERSASSNVIALSELILATEDPALIKEMVGMKDAIIREIDRCGWAVGHAIHKIADKKFNRDLSEAVAQYQDKLRTDAKESPFGVPYRPNIWGAGWTIQRFGVDQYFFYKGWPQHTGTDFFVNALNFVLGVHPGINTASFASGVGSESVTVAYGVNRGDWSFIPGGVVSGTNLVRPDLPELKIWPFFWQQTEYVMGGGATNYMFLVLALDHLYKNK
jgi:endoglucanase